MSSRLHPRREVPDHVRATLELRQGTTAQPRPGKRRSDARGGRQGVRNALRKAV
jgi:hypothetical protein